MREADLGQFVRWGAAVSVDVAKRLLTVLPFANEEDIVEIPNADTPSEEALDIRCSSY